MNIMQKLYYHQKLKQLYKTAMRTSWKSEETTHYTVIKPFYAEGRFYKAGEIVLIHKDFLEKLKVSYCLEEYLETGEQNDYYRKSII